MAGDDFAGRTGGVTRIRRAGENSPPVADASMSQIDPPGRGRVHRSAPRRLRALIAPPCRHADQGTRWHQAAYVSPEREPHCSPHSVDGVPSVWRSRVAGRSCHGGCVLELYRGQHAKAAVASLPVMKDLQIRKDRVGKLDAGAPALLVEEFD